MVADAPLRGDQYPAAAVRAYWLVQRVAHLHTDTPDYVRQLEVDRRRQSKIGLQDIAVA